MTTRPAFPPACFRPATAISTSLPVPAVYSSGSATRSSGPSGSKRRNGRPRSRAAVTARRSTRQLARSPGRSRGSTGSNCWKAPVCRADRSTRSIRCSPIRKCSICRWRRRWTAPWQAPRRWWPRPSASPASQRRSARRRRNSASAPKRCWDRSGIAPTRSPTCAGRGRSDMDTLPGGGVTREYAGGKMLAAKDDGVGLITFNQPEKRNAMSMEMWAGLGDIFDEFAEDGSVRVVILSGAGNKAFVSGADISQFEKNRSNANAQQEYDRQTSIGRAKFAAFPKPVIARIRGFCLGGGLAIAMRADLRIAAVDSQFGIPAAKLSIAYAPDSVKRLIDLVGPAHARMILYTAKRIDAAEAERIGLINRMVEDEVLNDVVLDIARTIADNAPLSVAASKLTINEMLKDESQRDMDAIKKIGELCFNSADYKEGRTAFMEKRSPRFVGR